MNRLFLLFLPLLLVLTACPSGPKTSSISANGVTVTALEEAKAGEAVSVRLEGLPGNPQDWVTLIKASESDQTYGEWTYTGGLKTFTKQFTPTETGDYEVRVYFNWPNGGYEVKVRKPLKVK